MDFVVSHAQQMTDTEARVFTSALEPGSECPLPLRQAFDTVKLPFGLRRRAYVVGEWDLARAIISWRPDVVNQHFIGAGRSAVHAARRLDVPLITTVHAQEPSIVEALSSNPVTRYHRRSCESTIAHSDLFISVSEYIGRWLMELGVDPTRIKTNYVGVDTRFWTPTTSPETRLKQQRVLFVGRMSKGKGVDDLLAASQAVNSRRPHQLELVGDDADLGQEIRRMVSGDPRIVVHGVASQSRIRDLLASTTVLVLPAKTNRGIQEAAGLVLLEGQAMGVPVVAYRSGGTPEMLATPEHLIPESDVSALAGAIEGILASDARAYRGLSESVREWTRVNRSSAVTAMKTQEILRLEIERRERGQTDSGRRSRSIRVQRRSPTRH